MEAIKQAPILLFRSFEKKINTSRAPILAGILHGSPNFNPKPPAIGASYSALPGFSRAATNRRRRQLRRGRRTGGGLGPGPRVAGSAAVGRPDPPLPRRPPPDLRTGGRICSFSSLVRRPAASLAHLVSPAVELPPAQLARAARARGGAPARTRRSSDALGRIRPRLWQSSRRPKPSAPAVELLPAPLPGAAHACGGAPARPPGRSRGGSCTSAGELEEHAAASRGAHRWEMRLLRAAAAATPACRRCGPGLQRQLLRTAAVERARRAILLLRAAAIG